MRQSYEKCAVQGEMHGIFLGAWRMVATLCTIACKVLGSTPRVPAMRNFAQSL
nr:MAG TPA: hypothetical protein [Caudoviricetes sp.]DAS39232.1 MAG TPA: hypothetical protein [Bacteriophage sp.]